MEISEFSGLVILHRKKKKKVSYGSYKESAF